MFASFFYAPASVLGRGIIRLMPESIFFWGERCPLALPARSTAGDLHARRLHVCSSSMSWCCPVLLVRSVRPGELGLFVLLLGCWTQPSLVPQAPSETGGGEQLLGCCACLFITSHPGIPILPNTFRVTAISPDKCNAWLSKPTTCC